MRLFSRVYAGLYDVVSAWVERRAGVKAHRRRLVAEARGEVLEVGAGTGRNLELYESADRVVALEPEAGMRERAQRRAHRARVPVEVVDGDGMALPFPDGSFDTVVTSLVLCTIPDPARALAEINRVLRPGGTVRFYEHVRAGDPKLAARQDRWCGLWRRLGRGCHPNRDTVSLIEAAGFRVRQLEEHDVSGVPSIVRPHVLGVAERE